MTAQDRPIVADISGGKDSIAMAIILCEGGERVDSFLYIDTGYDLPEAYEAIDRFERLYNRPVIRLGAGVDFLYVAAEIWNGGKMNRRRGYGWPTFRRRWCNYELKRRAISAFDRANGWPIHLIGIAADEPKRLKPHSRKRYPLAEWGLTENDCLNVCRERGFYPPGGVYDHRRRIGCWCCPFQSNSDARWLCHAHPELWERLKEMERVIGEPWKGGTHRFEEEVRRG